MKKITWLTGTFVLTLLIVRSVSAEIISKPVEYKHGKVILEGYLSYDNTLGTKRPGILVIHDWNGIDEYEKERTKKLAGIGYVAFAGDMYGKGIRPKTQEESSKQAAIYRADRKLMRARAGRALEVLKSQKNVNKKLTAAMGYCFGGGTALELARSGADIKGVVSFHGNLDTPKIEDAKNIKAKILVLHGADDPYVPEEQITAFKNEMDKASVDWQMIWYSHAVHAFTVPDAGNDPSKGAAYNSTADKRSWNAMKLFFNELFID